MRLRSTPGLRSSTGGTVGLMPTNPEPESWIEAEAWELEAAEARDRAPQRGQVETGWWRRKCSAHSRQTGQPCGAWAIAGGEVCRHHGGALPNTQEAARERLRTLVHPALQTLASIMSDEDAPAASRVRAAADLLDRAGLKSVDVTVQVSSEQANEDLDSAIAAALASRFDGAGAGAVTHGAAHEELAGPVDPGGGIDVHVNDAGDPGSRAADS